MAAMKVSVLHDILCCDGIMFIVISKYIYIWLFLDNTSVEKSHSSSFSASGQPGLSSRYSWKGITVQEDVLTRKCLCL